MGHSEDATSYGIEVIAKVLDRIDDKLERIAVALEAMAGNLPICGKTFFGDGGFGSYICTKPKGHDGQHKDTR